MQFIRSLWGSKDRWVKVKKDVTWLLKRPFQVPFECWTYGKDNHKFLLDLGVNSKLIWDEPYMFSDKQFWGHKMYVWKEASKVYDKYIYLDWDVTLASYDLPEMFDGMFRKRFGASLRQYYNIKCPWRKEHARKCPCASFLWFNDNKVAKEIWQLWVKMGKPRKEERVLAKYTEGKNGLDLKQYWKNHEIFSIFHLDHETTYKQESGRGMSMFKHFAH